MSDLILPSGVKHTQAWADANRVKKLKEKWRKAHAHHAERNQWHQEQDLPLIAATHAGAAAAFQEILEDLGVYI